MAWTLFKHALNRSWTWIKFHWYVPIVIICALLLAVFIRRRNSSISDAIKLPLQISRKSYKTQVKEIEKIKQQEIKQIEKNEKVYIETVKQVENKLKEEKEELSNKQKKEIKNIVETHGDNPDILAHMISEKYGIEYVSKN